MPTAGIDLKEHIATIIDTGAEKFSGTYIADVGNAVAQVLLHPAETKNREVDIASITLSRNELLAALEAETGTTWTVKRITSAEEYKIAEAAMGKGDMWTGFMHVVVRRCYQLLQFFMLMTSVEYSLLINPTASYQGGR
jgi:hypothetical protein